MRAFSFGMVKNVQVWNNNINLILFVFIGNNDILSYFTIPYYIEETGIFMF